MKDSATSFSQRGYAEIRDFLDVELAEEMRDHMLSDSAAWEAVACPSQDKTRGASVNVVGSREARIAESFAVRNFSEGGFSYTCLKISGHPNCGDCPECSVRALMHSRSTMQRIKGITGVTIDHLYKNFFVHYRVGDFISPHTDNVNGKIGFTLQLSKDWEPRHGGLLHFLDGPKGDIKGIAVPTFNTLTLFETDKQDTWHMVSQVAPGAPPRLSMSGWYDLAG